MGRSGALWAEKKEGRCQNGEFLAYAVIWAPTVEGGEEYPPRGRRRGRLEREKYLPSDEGDPRGEDLRRGGVGRAENRRSACTAGDRLRGHGSCPDQAGSGLATNTKENLTSSELNRLASDWIAEPTENPE
jgi:hypothetical protein